MFLSLNKQIDEHKIQKTELHKLIDQKEAEVEKKKADLIKKENLLSSRQKTLNEHINKTRQYESDKKIKNERLRFLTDKSTNLNEQISQDKMALERIHVEIKNLEEQKESAEKMLAEVELKLAGLDEERLQQKEKTVQLQEEYNVLNNRYRAQQEEVFQLRKSLEVNEIQLSNLKQELEKTSSDNQDHSLSVEETEAKLKTFASTLKEVQKSLDGLVAKDEANKKSIEACEVEIEKIRTELSNLNRELDSKQNEYNLTKSLVDNLEGYPEAIKFLKKNSKWGEDATLLSDIVTCDEKYRVAIENYLESVMSYYVVDDYVHAYQAVNLLSESSKGRANFFVLSSFNNVKYAQPASIDKCIPALDIVEYDEKYKSLVQHVLNNVYLSESEVLPEGREEVFIAKNGKVTKKPFSISGGSVGLFEGKRIGRAKNLEKLEKEIKKLTEKQDKIKHNLNRKQTELQEYKAINIKQEIDATRKEFNEINEQYISTKMRKEQIASMIENNTTKKEDILQNIRVLQDALEKNKPKLDLQEVELANITDQITQLNEEVTQQNDLLNQKANSFNQENINKHQQQNRVQSIEQEASYKRNTEDTTKQRIEKNTIEIQKTDSEIKQLAENSDHNDTELISLYEEKESIEKGVNEAEKDYYQSRGQITEVEVEVKEIQRKRENADALLMEIQNKLNETKLALTSTKERLSVEFNINIDQLLLAEEENEEEVESIALTEEQLQEKVDNAKSRIHSMGPINPMAMEAYT